MGTAFSFSYLIGIIFVFILTPGATCNPVDTDLQRRAATSSQYAPVVVECPPNRPTIQTAENLSANETTWLPLRRNNTITALRDFLARANLGGFNASDYVTRNSPNPANLPVIGIAISGGGYRAMMNGAGALSAFDSRTANSTAVGQLGGLLQSSTYLAGLSGGSWLLGSLYMNDFVNVQTLLNGSAKLTSLWQFDQSILDGPEGFKTRQYYEDLFADVGAKKDAGFETTLTDYWGRALSYQLFNAQSGDPGFRFSDLAHSSGFSSGSIPMPLIVIDQRAPNELLLPVNTTNFEINPWEFGSTDASTNAMAPLEYIASDFSGGIIPSNGQCRQRFDNIGFVVGTSSSLFNQFYLNLNSSDISSTLKGILTSVLQSFGASNNDISIWPNPFTWFNNGTTNSAVGNLTLVDGGEDLQNVPFHPLLRQQRQVDVIFAIDSSADTNTNWPNGTAPIATYQRFISGTTFGAQGFPHIPDYNTFVNLGLNSRPTFFGCDANNQSVQTPLVVYIPNAPISYHSNVSTFDLKYTDSERNSIIQNGYDVATRGNSSLDAQWPVCVGCAILSRSFNRTGEVVPYICTQCFTRYCWNGTVNSTVPNLYEPLVVFKQSDGIRSFGSSLGVLTVLVGLALVV